MKQTLLALLFAVSAAAQVTVSFSYPANTATIGGGGIQISGPVASSAAAITLVELSINGGSFTGAATLFGMPPTQWLMSLQGSSLTVGATTLQVRATDAMMNTGVSSVINVTVIHSNPQCSHTTVPGSSTEFCEQAVTSISTSSNVARSVTLTGGLTAGQLIFCQAEASVPASPETQLSSGVTAGATLIHVTSSAGFPSTPFFATLSPVGGLGTGTPQIPNPEDTVTVTAMSGAGNLDWTVTAVGHNHVSGEVVGNWSVVQGQSNYPWKSSYLTNSLGYTFTFYDEIGTRATDSDVEQIGNYFAFVPATTGSNEVITSQNPNGTGQVNLLQCVLFSGVGSVGNGAHLMGWGGQNDGSTTLPGPAYVDPFSVTVGDLIVSSVFAAPIKPISPAIEAIEDTSKPFGQINYFAATTSTVQPETDLNVDGFFQTSIAFHPTVISGSGVQVFISEPFPRTQPGEAFAELSSVIASATSNAGSITNMDLSFDGGPYNATFGPLALLSGSVWNVNTDVRPIPEGIHTFRVKATDSMGNSAVSPVVSANVVHTAGACNHTVVGPTAVNVFCEKYATLSGGSGSPFNLSMTIPAVAGVGLKAGETIILQASMGTNQVYETTLAAPMTSGATIMSMVGNCSNFPSPPFDIKVNEHATYANYGRVEKVTVSACTGTTATLSARGVAGADCVTPNGDTTSCSIAIAHDINAIVNRWGDQIPQITDITTTHSYTWTLVKGVSSGPFADLDDANGAIMMTVVPSDTAVDEVVTFTNTHANFMIMSAVVYSGLGAIESGASYLSFVSGPGGPPATTGPYPSEPGDINIALIAGAPTTIVPSNPPTIIRGEDTIRPFTSFVDQYSIANFANIGRYMNSEGASDIGMAFKTLVPATQFGRSIVLSSQTASTSTPGIASNGTCRMEIRMHTVPGATDWGQQVQFEHPIQNATCDINTYWIQNPGEQPLMLLSPLHNVGASDCQIPFVGKNLVDIRWQRKPTSGTTGQITCQAVDENGLVYVNLVTNYTSITGPTSTAGFIIGGTTVPIAYGYARIYSSAVPATSTPPTTAQDQTAAIFQWKFDSANQTGTLADSTGNMLTAVLSSGSPTYVPTPYQTLIKSTPRTGIVGNGVATPSWTPWISFKVNSTNQLDGTTSYTQSNSTPNVTCLWSNITADDPVVPTIVSPNSCLTDVTGLTQRGTYTFNLHTSDATGNAADQQLLVGAVDYNNDGVLVQSDLEEQVYAPQIVFGQNPYGYADERHCTAVMLQLNGQDCNFNQLQPSGNPYFATTTWLTPATGTVTYTIAGIGPAPGQGCYGSGVSGGTKATLSADIMSTDTTIHIHHAECLHGLLSLPGTPTWILIGNSLGNDGSTGGGVGLQEQVCIASTTATTGDADLTTCYDGRGMAGAFYLNAQPIAPASMWPSTTTVGEMLIQGSGTLFVSDPVRALCPNGAPGPPGEAFYFTGTVSGTAGSTTLTAHSASWTQNVFPSCGVGPSSLGILNTDCMHNMQAQVYIRVFATHDTGMPFSFWAFVTAVAADNLSITISRPLPTNFDSGNFNYVFTSLRYASLDYTSPSNSNIYRALTQLSGCASETTAFGAATHDITALNLMPLVGQFSYKDLISAGSPFGPDFYAEGLQERRFEHRSGYKPAVISANKIDDNYIRDPEISGALGGLVLDYGGGVVGSIIDKIFNVSTPLTWLDIQPFAASGAATALLNCNTADPRDQGYPQGWNALAALGDTDPTRQTAWVNGLLAWKTRDETCRRNAVDGYAAGFVPGGTPNVYTNSWAGASIFDPASVPLTLVNGSTNVAPTTGIVKPGMCAGIDDGTGLIHVTPGLTAATVVSGTVNPGARITITDTSVSPPLVVTRQFSVSGGNVTLAALWPGLTAGDYHFMVEDNSLGGGYMTSIGVSNLDWPDVTVAAGLANNKMLQPFWACHYVNSGQLKLNRPWDQRAGTTTDNHMVSYVTSGFELQGFMLTGIKASGMRWASKHSNSTISTAYQTMSGQLGNWMATYGLDLNNPGTLGMYYNRVSGDCEEPGIPNAVHLFDTIHAFSSTGQPGCGLMGLTTTLGDGTGEFTSRVNTAEGTTGLAAYLKAQCLLGVSQCNAAKTFVLKYYGAIWGDCSMTRAGYYCDPNFVNKAGEFSNVSLGAYKWPGFTNGMGNASSIPAEVFSYNATITGNHGSKGNRKK
jgi:hypothetical protein